MANALSTSSTITSRTFLKASLFSLVSQCTMTKKLLASSITLCAFFLSSNLHRGFKNGGTAVISSTDHVIVTQTSMDGGTHQTISEALEFAIDEALDPASSLPPKPRMYFVHVGKAGGLTLNLLLNLQRKKQALRCRMNRTQLNQDDDDCYAPFPGESQLSLHTLSHLHIGAVLFTREERQWLLDHTNTFLFVVRDPISRIISAYNFHLNIYHKNHRLDPPRNESITIAEMSHSDRFFIVCFAEGINQFVGTLKPGGDEDGEREICRKLGLKVLGGRKRLLNHFQYNYGYYRRNTIKKRPNHSVAVIRTENMWEDIMALDQMVGGTGNFTIVGTKVTHGSEKWAGKTQYSADLSPTNTKYLCCILYSELDIYQELILEAVNLNDAQRRETLSNVLAHCQLDFKGDPFSTPFSWKHVFGNATCGNAEEVLPLQLTK